MGDLNLDLTGIDIDGYRTDESADNDITGPYLNRRKNTISPELKQIMDEVAASFPGDVAMTGLQPEPKIGKSPAQAIYQKGRKPLDQMTPEERQSVVAMDQMRQGVPSSEALANVTLGTEDPWFDPIMVTGAGAGSGARIAAAAGKKVLPGAVAGGVSALAGESVVGPLATMTEDALPSGASLPVNLALGFLSGATLEQALEKAIFKAYQRNGIRFTAENIQKTATDFMNRLKSGDIDDLIRGPMYSERGSLWGRSRLEDFENWYLSKLFAGKAPAAESGQRQTVVMTGGPAGLGKTSMLREADIERSAYIDVNADDVKTAAGMSGAGRDKAFHEDSSTIANKALNKAIDGGYNTVYDSQLTNFAKSDSVIQRTLNNDGIVQIHFVYGDPETSKARNTARFLKGETDRLPPDDAILKGEDYGLPTFWELYKKYEDNPNVYFYLYDNNTDFRARTLVFRKDNNGLEVADKNLFESLKNISYKQVEGGTKYVRTERTPETVFADREAEIQRRIETLVGSGQQNGGSHPSGGVSPGSLAEEAQESVVPPPIISKSSGVGRKAPAFDPTEEIPVNLALSEIKSMGGLNLDSLRGRYSQPQITELVRKRPGLVSKNGRATLDDIADTHGYESGDDLLQDILGAKSKKAYADAEKTYIESRYHDEIRQKVAVGELDEGDKVIIDGEEFKHTGYDAEGNAIIKDGETFVADPFEVLVVDKVIPKGFGSVAQSAQISPRGSASAKIVDDVLPEVAHDVKTALDREVRDRLTRSLHLFDEPLVTVQKKTDYTAPVDPAVAEEFLRMEQSIPGEFAVNINFSKIDTEEDVKEIIAQTAKQFEGEIDAARRGRISQEQTQALADDLGMTVDQLLSRRAGQAFNAEEALAARRILVSSAVTLRDLAQKAMAPTASDIDRFAFRRALNIHYGIQAQVSGMTAEAGRALAQFKILAGTQDAMVRSIKEQMDLLAAAGKDSGKVSTEQLAAAIATVNPEALTRTVRQMRKATTLEMLREVWINGLLSGPITHMKNMISNTLVAIQQIPERAIAAGIGRAAQAVGGGPQEIHLAEAGAQILGIKGAFEDGFRLLGTFYDLARQGDKQGAMKLLAETFADDIGKIEQRAAITGENVLNTPMGKAVDKLGYGGQLARAADLLGEVVRIPGTALRVEDSIFKGIGYRMELHAQAYRRAVSEGLEGDALAARVAAMINDPPEDIALEARKNADYQTFTKALGEYGTKFQAFINSHPLGSLVVPFVRTPANILKYFGERTPLALASASIRADIAAGGAKRDLALARIGLGSVIMLMAGMWGYEGTLTGGGPKDPELAAGWRRTGWQPYSVKIGGTYYEYGSLEPVGTLLGIAADIGEITARKEAGDHDLDEVAGLAVAASVAFSKNVTEKSFLQGISNVVKPLYDPERYFAQTAKNYARSLIPGAVQQLNRTEIDPVVRETMGMIDAMKAATPGLSSTLPAKRDIWGDPIEREGSLGPDWLSPIKTSEDRRSIVDDEVKRLNVQLAMPQKVLGGKYLEAGDRPRLMELIGKTPDESGLNLKQAMEALISSPDYQSLTDGEDGGKAKAIRDLYNRYKRIGTAAFLDENRPLAEAIERRKQEKQEKVHGVQF